MFFWNGEEIEEISIDLSLVSLGEHELKIEAQDEAGNVAEEIVATIVATTVATIHENIVHYYELDLINKHASRVLGSQVKHLEKMFEFRSQFEKHFFWMHKRHKKRILRRIDRIIEFRIERLVRLTEIFESRGYIKDPAGELLKESLEFLKN